MADIKRFIINSQPAIQRLAENCDSLGIDIIELRYIHRTGQQVDPGSPFTVEIVGYEFPKLGSFNYNSTQPEGMWAEGTLVFYSDANGIPWGYVPDTPKNRQLIKTSLSTGFFMVTNGRLREEIIREAKEEGIDVEIPSPTEVGIKKTKRERQAEQHATNVEKKLKEMEDMKRKLEEELAIAKGEKVQHINKRLKGVKIPNRDLAMSNINGDDE